MNLNNILWVYNTGEIVPDAPIADNLFGMKLGGGGIITTATGNPVSIVTNKAQNAISTILSYLPKQSGTGDPSPQNIRPIEGWTEANLFGCGKNCFDYNNYENIDVTGQGGIRKGHIFNGGYTYTIINVSGSIFYFKQVAKDLSQYFAATAVENGETKSITINSDRLLYVYTINETTGIMVCVGESTTYEPYTQGATITESLGGTYYGFSIDLERGVLRVTHTIVDLSSLTWYENTFAGVSGYAALAPSDLKPVENSQVLPAICETLKTISFNAISTLFYGLAYRNNGWLYAYSDVSPTGKMVYELATPLELPITPQTVALLAGNNTLWCDGDSVTITYRR